MTLRTKILGGLGAAALVAGTWGGVSSATRRPGEFCFNYVTTPGEQLPSSVLGPDSPVHDTQIGPNLWRRCGAHAPKD